MRQPINRGTAARSPVAAARTSPTPAAFRRVLREPIALETLNMELEQVQVTETHTSQNAGDESMATSKLRRAPTFAHI
jgi:hypothetical protein